MGGVLFVVPVSRGAHPTQGSAPIDLLVWGRNHQLLQGRFWLAWNCPGGAAFRAPPDASLPDQLGSMVPLADVLS